MVFSGRLTALLLGALVALGCDRGGTDQADLKSALAADEVTSRALKQADDVAHAGRNAEAADLVKRVASPAADECVATANALSPHSGWGRTEKDALVALALDRRHEMDGYERALRVGSDEEKLAALTMQIEIEKRAAALADEIEHGP